MIPLTSIVTCVHNLRHLLPFALLSVRNQRSRDFEYLILDDGSSDGTWEYLQSLNFPWLRVLKNDQQQGLTACRNRLLKEARGELISILDGDDMLTPKKVESHALAMVDSTVGVVYGRAKRLTPSPRGYLIEESHGSDYSPGWDLITPYAAVHSATTWRKSLIRAVGGYDAQWTIVEDSDLFLKVGEKSQQLFIPQYAAIKRIQPNNAFRSTLTPEKIKQLSNAVLKNALQRRYQVVPTVW